MAWVWGFHAIRILYLDFRDHESPSIRFGSFFGVPNFCAKDARILKGCALCPLAEAVAQRIVNATAVGNPEPELAANRQQQLYTIVYHRHCPILYYTILYYTILYYTILYYTILYYTILYYTILYYTILYYTILYYTTETTTKTKTKTKTKT